MLKWISLGLLILPAESWAKTETLYIPSEPQPEESPYVRPDVPQTPEPLPFFAQPSTGHEAMEEIEALREQVGALDARVTELEKNLPKK